MDLRIFQDNQKEQYNQAVTHVMQSWEWGEFRKSLGTPVLRYGLYQKQKLVKAFQLTLHKIPFTTKNVGYLPKGPFPDAEFATALKQIAAENNCAFIKIEPDTPVIPAGVEDARQGTGIQETGSRIGVRDDKIIASDFRSSPKPLFTKYNFVLDLIPTETELLKNMHSKTRYNIKVAEKHGVKVEERTDDQALEIYLKLYFETTKRQGYHGHIPAYHKQVWQTLKKAEMARLLIAFYQNQPLTAWMLLNFKDTLYYPYGGSSPLHREVMHSNLVAWEAIKLGKKLNLKKLDMWGALGPNANPSDPWYGFHRFKQGYGGKLETYIGTFDLILDPLIYHTFTFIDKLMPLKLLLLKIVKN